MRNYRIEYTESENNYTYTGEWCAEIVEAETAEEAIELLKAHFVENGGDPEEYIYRVRWEEKTVKNYIFEEYRDKAGIGTQKTFTDQMQAVKTAVTEWQRLNYHDKQNYIDDPAGMFRVYEQDGENIRDILDLLQIEEMRTKNGYFDQDDKNYILTQQAYLAGANDNMYFTAIAICLQDMTDEDGDRPAYNVTWDIIDDNEDLQQNADWDSPATVELVGAYNLTLGRFY